MRAVEGSSKSGGKCLGVQGIDPIIQIFYDYTDTLSKPIQNAVLVGWSFQQRDSFVRKLLVPRKGIKPSTTASYQYLCGGFHTDLTHGSQPSVDASSQVERVELGPPGHTSQIFSSEKYLGSGGGNTFNWPYQNRSIPNSPIFLSERLSSSCSKPEAISYDF